MLSPESFAARGPKGSRKSVCVVGGVVTAEEDCRTALTSRQPPAPPAAPLPGPLILGHASTWIVVMWSPPGTPPSRRLQPLPCPIGRTEPLKSWVSVPALLAITHNLGRTLAFPGPWAPSFWDSEEIPEDFPASRNTVPSPASSSRVILWASALGCLALHMSTVPDLHTTGAGCFSETIRQT